MRRVYMAPEQGGEVSGGGGEAPATETPNETQTTDLPEGEPESKPEPKKEPAKDSKQEAPPKSQTDEKLGKVSGLVEQAGLTMKEVAAIAKANDGKLDLTTMVALTEKHGEAVAGLIADQIKDIHTQRTSEAKLRDKEIFDQVAEAFKDTTEQSGEETWKELAGWAKDNIPTETRAEINKLLAQGGLAAKLAVQELTVAFKESQATAEFQDADLLEADTTPKTSGGMLSKQDYNRELNKLLAAGHDYDHSADIARLNARRTKSIKSGY